jgi:hypothetical protein
MNLIDIYILYYTDIFYSGSYSLFYTNLFSDVSISGDHRSGSCTVKYYC